jgi:hypothetical protein
MDSIIGKTATELLGMIIIVDIHNFFTKIKNKIKKYL